jgi:tetratricopeptide (TPR) repeat protein
MLIVIIAAVCEWAFPQNEQVTRSFYVTMIVIIGYSFFFTAYNGSELPPSYDRRIIRDSFQSGGKRCRLFFKAYKLYQESDFNEALSIFNEIKEYNLRDRESAVLSFYIGRCYQFMGYATNASQKFRESIDSGIEVDEVYTLCGREMVSCGNFSAAEDVYNELLEKGSDSDYIYTDMGMLYIKANEPEKALEAFSTSVKKHLNYAFAMGGCALAYLLKKDVGNAKFFFGQAVLNNIDDVEGFTEYYINVAETQGVSDEIGVKAKPKLYIDPAKFVGGDE